MKVEIKELLQTMLNDYPDAEGINLFSLEQPLDEKMGKVEELEKYKDIPMLAIDDEYHSSFTFIITETGSVIIFFVDQVHFISIFSKGRELNKEFATRYFYKYIRKITDALENLELHNQ